MDGQTREKRSEAKSISPISGIDERYAGSLFDLALQSNAVGAVEADLDSFDRMLAASPDLIRLILSPVFSSEDQLLAISAIGWMPDAGESTAGDEG